MLRARHLLHNLGPEGSTWVGQEDKEDDEEKERGKVNREGSHDVPESRGALGVGSLGETLGQRTLLEEQRTAQIYSACILETLIWLLTLCVIKLVIRRKTIAL